MDTIDQAIKIMVILFAFVGIITVAVGAVELFDRHMAKKGWKIK